MYICLRLHSLLGVLICTLDSNDGKDMWQIVHLTQFTLLELYLFALQIDSTDKTSDRKYIYLSLHSLLVYSFVLLIATRGKQVIENTFTLVYKAY